MTSPPPRHVARPEREAYGRSLRDTVRRVDHDKWVTGDRDVLGRLKASENGRLPHVLPFRHGRMSTSPFAFLRGNAAIMAPDMMSLPHTGYTVQLCGDAHVRNLGEYSAPDGKVVFDINDFDETCRGPWEWDLKRLAISLVLVAREAGMSDGAAKDAVVAMIRTWRETMHELAELPAVELARYVVHRFQEEGPVGRVLSKAEHISPLHAREELCAPTAPDGKHRFVEAAPKLVRIPDEESAKVLASLAPYRETVGPSRQQVLECYSPYDVAFKVAGTGSIGVHNYAVICAGSGPDDSLILQVKEALSSTYIEHGWVDPTIAAHNGRRVAEGAHRMQTSVDPFIGWTTIDGKPYYVRQLADHKAAIDPTDLKRSSLTEYASVCGETFAKGHARTSDPAVLYGYAGEAAKLDRAIAKLALIAADQVTFDYELLVGAIDRHEIIAADID
ncbi:MAG TPA: DUF2252 domain-containing protein [Kofleriaceae bacterium]